jgi:pimeloyl-ACP methyl ester carboxylesterase
MNTLHSAVSFGGFRLDPASGRLSRAGQPVPLTPKAFAVLQFLAERPGRLVGKQDLLDALWPGVFVGDGALKVAIGEIRKALGDDPHAPRFIETAHRRGYRFVAAVDLDPTTAASRDFVAPVAPPASPPQIRYARSGHVNIAYQVVGDGPIDLVFVMGWVSHLEYFWNEPSFARFLGHLASKTRLILFDKRGTGLSDPVPEHQLPTLDQRLDDVRAVMEAAGSDHAVLLGVSEGGPLCTLFAATHPEKTDALIMIGSYARRLRDKDYPWGQTPEGHDAFCRKLLDEWGGPVGIEERAPSKASDPAFRAWWASYLRMGASPGAAVALTRMNAQIDVRGVLAAVQSPTLVLHRTGDRCLRVEEGRYLATAIPGATFVELPGDDHLPFVGAQEDFLGEIDRFLAIAHERRGIERVLATVLTMLCDCAARDRDHLRQVFTREVGAHRGRAVVLDPDRLVATFDGPGRAVRCGRAVATITARSKIGVRGGVHIGECDPAKPCGLVLDLSREIAAAAAPGEVLASRTVVDLVPGSGMQFADRGTLRAIPPHRELSLLAVVAG